MNFVELWEKEGVVYKYLKDIYRKTIFKLNDYFGKTFYFKIFEICFFGLRMYAHELILV